MFLRQILSCYNLKNFFFKLVKVLVLELFYGTRTRVHFSISVVVLVLEVFCGTRTRKLSTRLHHCCISGYALLQPVDLAIMHLSLEWRSKI